MDFGTGAGGNGAQAQVGPQLEEIQTDALGFHSFAGEAKLQLLKSPWPADALPPPTSSLLSVASNKGLLAAAGPDSVIIATTSSVREAFENASAGGNIKPFTPQLTLEVGTRISQVAFSADGSFLAISAEVGGGLAIYETQDLLKNNTKSAFELPTDGMSIRALVPNPAYEASHLFAIVTVNGQLMLADMKERKFSNGQNGVILKEGVSCVSWSPKGKQLVAGLGNGGVSQMTPSGVVKAEIPRPPTLEGDQHVSAISWLENKVFLVAHTPTSFDAGMIPSTTYHLITEHTLGAAYEFQLLPEVCSPFGLNRSPPFQFMQRLRDFPPNIQDIVIVASTAAEDIGLYTRSKTPLTNDMPAEKIAEKFTSTLMANDSRRAQLPMTEDMSSNTSVIGMALDLSSTSKVSRPIPGDELDESPGPLPALLILNNEAVLSGWWIVYSESVRSGTTYPKMAAVAGDQQPSTTSQSQAQAAPSPFAVTGSGQSAFGQSAFGQPSFGSATSSVKSTVAFGQSAFGSSASSSAPFVARQSPWGASSSGAQTGGATFGQPAFGSATPFGQANNAPAFGSATSLGQASKTPAFGSATPIGQASNAPAFGSATPIGHANKAPAFGSAGGLGSARSPWVASSTTPASTGTAFGQPSALSAPKAFGIGGSTPSAFSASSNALSGSSGGFASFASAGGFAAAAAAAPKTGTDSIFKQSTPNTSFTSTMDVGSSFGATPQKDKPTGSIFGGNGGEGFSLGSAWKNPDQGKQDQSILKPDTSGSLFGGDFSKTLTEDTGPSAPISKEADMSSDSEDAGQPRHADSKTVPANWKATKDAQKPDVFSANGRMFGAPSTADTSVSVAKGATTSTDEKQISSSTDTGPPTVIRSEPKNDQGDSDVGKPLPEAPLPPDPTSKASYTPGTSTNSSAANSKTSAEDAPLPPDFVKKSTRQKSPFDADDAPLPPDFTKPAAKPQASQDFFTDTPLPPDFARKGYAPKGDDQTPEKADAETAQQALPGEDHALPPDEDNELDEVREDGDEGSGVDVAEAMSPPTDRSQVTPESSFRQSLNKSPGEGSFENIPQPQARQAPKPLFGEIGKPSIPFFPPPSKLQQSPRSPSPIRASARPGILQSEGARSVSAPGVPLRAQSSRKVTLGRTMVHNAVYPPQFSAELRRNEERDRLERQKALDQAQEEQELSDDEDEKVRAELAADVEATLELESFVAHQDYVGNITKTGIPGTIEKVYRDINSMIDTLGLNSRSLKAFIKGHSELYSERGREREDLESDEGWCLEEVDYLVTLESSLEKQLEEGRLKDIKAKVDLCRNLRRELLKLKAKQTDIRHAFDAKTDPDLLEALRVAPLSAEQSLVRNDLRREYAAFQKVLAQAEEAISVLRAKLATQAKSNPKARIAAKVPTVEAVEKTILKMTSMVEKKSGDIDLLETQLRKLNVGSASVSRENSPFMTPPTSARKSRSAFQTPGSNMSASGFYTPKSSRSLRSSIIDSNGVTSSPSKKISDITQSDATRYAERATRRKQIHGLLKETLISGDVRVRMLDDI